MQAPLSRTVSVIGLTVSIGLSFAVASMGAVFRPGNWYLHLNKPSWTPPGYIFPPVWTALYIIMAVAAWLIWRRGGFAGAKVPLALYLLQLFLNALWSPLFFGLHSPGLGLVDILLLWFALLATVIAFFKTLPIAGWLLLPYLAWVSFATGLNFTVWRLN